MNVLTQILAPKKARITQIDLIACRVKILVILFTSRLLSTRIVSVKKGDGKREFGTLTKSETNKYDLFASK